MSRGAPAIGWSCRPRGGRAAARSGAGRACTGAAVAPNDLLGGAGLDEHARVHHVDALAHAGDDAEVVRDQDQRRVALGDEHAQQVEDLRLDRDVERRRRLVGDQQLRLARERHRDHRPLAHPARELVRIVAEPRLRARDPDLVEQLGRARVRPALRSIPKCVSSASRIWRPIVSTGFRLVIGSWKIIAISLARGPARSSLVRHRQQVAAVEARRAGRGAPGARQDPEHRERGDALAAARLADDPERLARRDVERDAVDRVDGAALGPELDAAGPRPRAAARSGTARAASGRAPRAARRRSG